MTMLAMIAAGMALTGCAAVAPNYQATIKNTRTLQANPGGGATVGQFNAKDDSLNHISIRGGTFSSPYGDSYSEYIKEALRIELESGGKLSDKTGAVITGELLKNTLDSGISTGTANISARVQVTRDNSRIFNKTFSVDTTWESSFVGAIAIPAAQRNYTNAIKQLIGKVVSDRDFQQAIK
jgi:hypothetical protein